MNRMPGLLLVFSLVMLCFLWQHRDWFPAYRRMQAHEQVNADFVQAVERSDVPGIEQAFARGADLSAVYSGSGYYADAVEFTSDEVLLVLMRHGLDINKPLTNGSTRLTIAAAGRNPDGVKFLLAHGADIHAQGGAALRAAADRMASDVELAQATPPGDIPIHPGDEARAIAAAKEPNEAIIRLLKAAGAAWTPPAPPSHAPYHSGYPVKVQTRP